jgi:DNA-binding MarR family transcriptional regulator
VELSVPATSDGVGAIPNGGTAPGTPMLLYLIKQIELAVRARLDDLVRPVGLTALQYTALTVLERNKDLAAAQLARRSFVTAQAMADMVTALESRGLIERHRDTADRRRLVIALTTLGQDLVDQYRDQVRAIEADMLVGLSEEEITDLRHSLAACRGNLASRRA